MSNRPTGTGTGIFSLFFREAGLFYEQAWEWANERARDTQKFVEDQAKEDRVLLAEDDKRRLADAQIRKTEAEARLLEQIRLAKEAGLDVDAILKRVREELK
jgi:hypothetical protein